MENINMKTIIDALSGNVLDAHFEDFDQATIDNAKNRIMDVIGCAIGGANAPGNAELMELVEDWGGKKEATILAHGVKVPVPTAAMVNCIMCRSYDFEPVSVCVRGMMYPGHMSGTTVLTAVTLGESRGINGKELITALVVGDDVCSRLAGAVNQPWDTSMEHRLKPLTAKQFVPWGTIAAFGATAIAGRLLGLSKLQMRNAFGIVSNMLSGAGGATWEATSHFNQSQGTSARNGTPCLGYPVTFLFLIRAVTIMKS